MRGLDTEFSDRDFMGITVEPAAYVTGLGSFGQVELKTAAKGERSGQGDEETVIYGLKKWASLAQAGNPTVLEMLFAPSYEVMTHHGEYLIENRDLFVSKEAGRRFLGYSKGQREALTGMRNKRTNRPELEHTFGYDAKFAQHMMRTLFQGIELMQTGTLKLPFEKTKLRTLRSIREVGKWTKQEMLAGAEVYEEELRRAIEESDLPEHADRDKINELLHGIYLDKFAEDVVNRIKEENK